MLRDPVDVVVDDVSSRHREVCRDCLWELLDGRRVHLHADNPRRWRAGDVRAVLELTATRLVDYCDLPAHAVPALRAYLDDLSTRDTLHPGSARPAALQKELDREGETFPEAITDRSRWMLAKTIYAAMREDGVDLRDPQATDRWAARFTQLSPAQREPILGHLATEQPGLLVGELFAADGIAVFVEPLPHGERTATSTEVLDDMLDRPGPELGVAAAMAALSGANRLAAILVARDSELLAHLLTVSHWLIGRTTTTRGGLVPADITALVHITGETTAAQRPRSPEEAPHSSRLVRIAEEVGLVVAGTPRWAPGPRLISDPEDVDGDVLLDLWVAVLDVLSRETWARPAATASENSALNAGSALNW
ncbi:hypothetical protein SAMN06264364_1023 [Quadrisphaera granulorum]|uniref:Uncharacterized protein n=1 Tax=Quadrisphaera granulorum TaxID=317664 RepID=A0A316ADD8_9ACTN|nr:hypothetical protein [Quadrisphaera granulorum]PWJ55641.1 hypothetical protein BXY45_1023 [Quadrisphaera granulorum]SZE95138.1 hypothetical protein SAMN06264364_1023 [Quadrisphaera granulorum]